MRVFAVPRSMAMSFEIRPKRDENIPGSEGLGLKKANETPLKSSLRVASRFRRFQDYHDLFTEYPIPSRVSRDPHTAESVARCSSNRLLLFGRRYAARL